MFLNNVHFRVAKNLTLTGTQYIPGPTAAKAYFTNTGYPEMVLYAQRVSEAGSGGLTITLEEYDPTCEQFFAVLGGAGAALGFVAWAGDETDTVTTDGTAGGRQILRIGSGIIPGDVDTILAVNTEDMWAEYSPPQFWRLKAVEAGTSSVVTIGGQYRAR